jgi:hypothetical protein
MTPEEHYRMAESLLHSGGPLVALAQVHAILALYRPEYTAIPNVIPRIKEPGFQNITAIVTPLVQGQT